MTLIAPDSPFTATTLIVIRYIPCGGELMLLLFNGNYTCEHHLNCLAHFKKNKNSSAQQQNSTCLTSDRYCKLLKRLMELHL